MPTSEERLIGVRAKIERADQHIRDLEGRLHTFLETDPYGVRSEDDPQVGDKVQKVEIRSQIPTNIPLIAGEVVQHLRGALDHLAWQLVEANGKTPGKKTYFPICESAAKYKTESPAKVKGMSPAAISLIDSLHPYKGGNDVFWQLHELNNFDKHRMLFGPAYGQKEVLIDIAIDLALRGTTPRFEIVGTGLPGVKCPILQDGTIVGRVENIGQSNDDVQFNITFEIAFREPQIVQGEPVVPFLHQLSGFVDSIVSQFVPFL